MGFFDKISKQAETNSKTQATEQFDHSAPAQKVGSRYTYKMLAVAHENMWWRKAGEKDVGVMKFPVNNPENDEVEIYYQLPKENANTLLKELFTVLHQIDDIVNDSEQSFDITYFDVCEDKITIGYWGTEENSSFEAKVFKEADKWYCEQIGTKKYNPSLCLGEQE
jgi:hypothetical protein